MGEGDLTGLEEAGGKGLEQEERSDEGQADVDEPGELGGGETPVEDTAEQDGRERDGQGFEIDVGNGGDPQAGKSIAGESQETGGQEVGLQGGAEAGGGPAAEAAVDGQGRAVHAIGSAEYAGEEATEEQCGEVLFAELKPVGAEEGVQGQGEDKQAKGGLDRGGMAAGEQEQPQRKAEESGSNEPGSGAEMDAAPVLQHDHGADSDGEQRGERSRESERKNEGEEGDRDESFAEAEGRADQGGEEDDDQDVEGVGEVEVQRECSGRCFSAVLLRFACYNIITSYYYSLQT